MFNLYFNNIFQLVQDVEKADEKKKLQKTDK